MDLAHYLVTLSIFWLLNCRIGVMPDFVLPLMALEFITVGLIVLGSPNCMYLLVMCMRVTCQHQIRYAKMVGGSTLVCWLTW